MSFSYLSSFCHILPMTMDSAPFARFGEGISPEIFGATDKNQTAPLYTRYTYIVYQSEYNREIIHRLVHDVIINSAKGFVFEKQ